MKQHHINKQTATQACDYMIVKMTCQLSFWRP